jgi:hypothetical protein
MRAATRRGPGWTTDSIRFTRIESPHGSLGSSAEPYQQSRRAIHPGSADDHRRAKPTKGTGFPTAVPTASRDRGAHEPSQARAPPRTRRFCFLFSFYDDGKKDEARGPTVEITFRIAQAAGSQSLPVSPGQLGC